jgi:hypothetical protein
MKRRDASPEEAGVPAPPGGQAARAGWDGESPVPFGEGASASAAREPADAGDVRRQESNPMQGTAFSASRPSMPEPPRGPLEPYWIEDRLVDPRVSDGDRTVAAFMHLWWVLIPVLGPLAAAIPLVAWMARQSSSPFIDDHGRETINLQLTALLFLLPPLWPVLVPWAIYLVVASLRATMASSRREYFRYPMVFRPLG